MKEALDLMDMISPGQIEAYRSKDEEEQNSFIERFKNKTFITFVSFLIYKLFIYKLKLIKL